MAVRASVARSADSSKVSLARRWTPPIPPVAKTRIPARRASVVDEATVVAACREAATASGSSRTPTLATSAAVASVSSWSGSSPTVGWPAGTPTVAGTTPAARSIASSSKATSRLRGRGRPWLMIVDSRATTGRPASSAAWTSGATVKGKRALMSTMISRSP